MRAPGAALFVVMIDASLRVLLTLCVMEPALMMDSHVGFVMV